MTITILPETAQRYDCKHCGALMEPGERNGILCSSCGWRCEASAIKYIYDPTELRITRLMLEVSGITEDLARLAVLTAIVTCPRCEGNRVTGPYICSACGGAGVN